MNALIETDIIVRTLIGRLVDLHGRSNLADYHFVRDGRRDPLGFFVLSYLLGAAMCGVWAMVVEPFGRVRRRGSGGTGAVAVRLRMRSPGNLRSWKPV